MAEKGENIVWMTTAYRWILVGIILVAFFFRVWGLARDLPYSPAVDEPERVKTAINMLAKGSLNPGYFNHPSSTVIYPLAGLFHLWHVVFHQGDLGQAHPKEAFYAHLHEFYLLGRLLTVGFTILTVPLLYQVGRRAFDRGVGSLGAAWWVIFPGVAYYTQVARDDLAATFFGLLSIWFCLKLYDRAKGGHPLVNLQLLAGTSIGLAIATRYFMVALVVVLAAVDFLILQAQFPTTTEPNGGLKPYLRDKRLWLSIVAGVLAIPLAFFLVTPYFLLDFGEALADVLGEARTTHLGADGLSPTGNLWWHLTRGVPGLMTQPLAILAAVGLGVTLRRPAPKPILLMGFSVVFLVEISLHPLHQQRWLIQILPLLALFASVALIAVVTWISTPLKWSALTRQTALIVLAGLISIQPVYYLTWQGIRLSNPSTNLLAREWILENIPEGSKIAQEAYSAYLVDGVKFVVGEAPDLASAGYTLADAYQAGYRYVVIKPGNYRRYRSQPERYPAELQLYQELFDTGILLQEFTPTLTQTGPAIQIYKLSPAHSEGD